METQDGRYFCKIVYVIADPQIYRTFESIKNCQRCDFLKIFVIPGGNATPHKFQRGDTSAPLPNRSGRYQGTTPTTWLNFNTPCKSQLKNAWPFSPTTRAVIVRFTDNRPCDVILRAKRQLRDNGSLIFMNEDLTQHRAKQDSPAQESAQDRGLLDV